MTAVPPLLLSVTLLVLQKAKLAPSAAGVSTARFTTTVATQPPAEELIGYRCSCPPPWADVTVTLISALDAA